jgi:hypothetical protein
MKDLKQIIREFLNENRIYLSQNGTDGFGYVMNIHLKNSGEKIGSIVFRVKKYLEKLGYPTVLELHIGFEEEYQGRGYFQDALIELLNDIGIPIFISTGRIINKNVFKAVYKLNKSLLNVDEIDSGFIITKKLQ